MFRAVNGYELYMEENSNETNLKEAQLSGEEVTLVTYGARDKIDTLILLVL